MGKFVDLTGMKFGHLTVVRKSDKRKIHAGGRADILWECTCDCGYPDVVYKMTGELKKAKNPGCPNCSSLLEDLTGKVFGELTVIERGPDLVHPSGVKARRWWCFCSCNPSKRILIHGRRLSEGEAIMCPDCSEKYKGQNCIKTNKYDLSGEFGVGYTYNGDEFYFDKEDFEKIKPYCWWKSNDGYIYTTLRKQDGARGKNISMHRFVLDLLADKKYLVDHANHNTCDNRKANLRKCIYAENCANTRKCKRNTSGVPGVSYDKRGKKWYAYIGHDGKTENLGLYKNFDDAVKARKEAEEKYFGEFSYDNSMKVASDLPKITSESEDA